MIKQKRAFVDLLYCVVAVGLMNGTLQFLVYPIVNKIAGSVMFGRMLVLLGVISVISPSFGLAVNNIRLVLPDRDRTVNSDFIRAILLFSLVSAAAAWFYSISQNLGKTETIWFLYIIIVSILRNYVSVEYRLNLNFKGQLAFYVVLSLGYIGGMTVFIVTKLWYWIFIIGETAAVLYVLLTGSIFASGNKTRRQTIKVLKESAILAGSYLLTNLMLNLDRFVLKSCIDSDAVSLYYVVSLLGKTVAIVSGPLNSVLIGYLSRNSYGLNKRQYRNSIVGLLLIGLVFSLLCICLTPIFVKLFYSNLYGNVMGLNVIVNTAQIVYFITNSLLIVILTMGRTKWQLYIQILYAATFVCISVISTKLYGIRGFAYAALISNSIYFGLTVLAGLWLCSSENSNSRQQIR